MRALLFAAALAACSSTHPDDVTCGPGTELIDDVCLPVHADAGHGDATPADAAIDASPDAPPDAAIDASPDAPPDAAIQGDEATAFSIDPAHDNLQPADTVASPLVPAWTASFDGAVSYPLIVGGMAIVAVSGSPPTVRALDVHTGALVWGPIVFGVPQLLAYDAGQVFAFDFHGHLTALDLVTGAQRWVIEVYRGATFGSVPVATGGIVYIDGPGSRTTAYDEQTGTMRWQSQGVGGDGGVAISGGVTYQTSVCEAISAWDALTGAVQWSHNGTCSGGGGASPSVYGGMIWERDAFADDVIWSQTGTANTPFVADAAPAFHGGTVFYQTNGSVKAFDIATGAPMWTFTGDGQLCTAPVVAGSGGQVFAGSRLGHVYEIDENTGAQRSVHDAGGAITCFSETNMMTLGENHLLVPAGNQLVAY
jgi:outer membrane protein assembly factor BamB